MPLALRTLHPGLCAVAAANRIFLKRKPVVGLGNALFALLAVGLRPRTVVEKLRRKIVVASGFLEVLVRQAGARKGYLAARLVVERLAAQTFGRDNVGD